MVEQIQQTAFIFALATLLFICAWKDPNKLPGWVIICTPIICALTVATTVITTLIVIWT
jgi:hypothetical protein